MSTYGSRRDRSLDNDPHWERLMLKAASAPPVPRHVPSAATQDVQDYAKLRKAAPVNKLLPATVDWIRSVPGEVRPVALASRFARIVNLIAQHWNDPDACAAYFDTLLVDRRGNRQGFPAAVTSDLRLLQTYFMRRHPLVSPGAHVGR
jgi:hypothetical protein